MLISKMQAGEFFCILFVMCVMWKSRKFFSMPRFWFDFVLQTLFDPGRSFSLSFPQIIETGWRKGKLFLGSLTWVDLRTVVF